MLPIGWHSEIKLLASGNAVSNQDGARQLSEDAGLQYRHHHAVLREVDVLVRPGHAVAGTLQCGDSCPSTTVDNYVDRLSSSLPSLPAPHRPLSQGVSVV
jgi:hypothetical protein